ncbi:pentapeptide repeat-containing protein [Williamsia soli]|uniref:pentapeptide repeat-containing protein n=1 Tax=Williamsia soli TaxID=364929 RepID=UPI001A9FCCE4|nr:pentapeptide repeat-containing protein [Williamsia soli]
MIALHIDALMRALAALHVGTPSAAPAPSPRAEPGAFLTQPVATVIGGLCVVAAGVLAFLVAYWNRRQTEKHWRTSNRQDRFTAIGTQLADKSAAVRIAGVYAMEALVDDWLKPRPIPWTWYLTKPTVTWNTKGRTKTRNHLAQRSTGQAQACINVLCAYLRLPPIKDGSKQTRIYDFTAGLAAKTPPVDLHVRQSIVRTIAAHLTDKAPGEQWSHLDFDLSGARLYDAKFAGSHFRGTANFQQVQFYGESTSFGGAQFHGKNTSFSQAEFHSDRTSFGRAHFYSELTTFFRTQFHGWTTSFSQTAFHGKRTSFSQAEFRSKSTSFTNAQFSGEQTTFKEAQFHRGRASFNQARFCCTRTLFDQVQFRGERTSFNQSQFRGERTSFKRAQFHSQATTFFKAQFHGQLVSFYQVTFDGQSTAFTEAQFQSRRISYLDPAVWENVHFDWDWPLPSAEQGPGLAKPDNVQPDPWPPPLSIAELCQEGTLP